MKKKIISFCIVVVLLVAAISGQMCVVPAAEAKYHLYIKISLHENWFFDKYAVDVYFDDTKLTTLNQGEDYTELITCESGSHTFYFYKSDDHNIKSPMNVNVDKDSTFSCWVQTHGKSMDVNDAVISGGADEAKIDLTDVTFTDAENAASAIKDAGIANVSLTDLQGKKIDSGKGYTVISQNPEASRQFSDAAVTLSCQKTEEFLNNNFNGKTVGEASLQADQYEIPVNYRQSQTQKDLTEKVNSLTEEEKDLWTVESSEINGKLKLNILYNGEAAVPDVTWKTVAETVSLLEQNNIYSYSVSDDITSADSMLVYEQSVPAGTVITGKDVVQLSAADCTEFIGFAQGQAKDRFSDILGAGNDTGLTEALSAETAYDSSIGTYFTENTGKTIVLYGNVAAIDPTPSGNMVYLIRNGKYDRFSGKGPRFTITFPADQDLPFHQNDTASRMSIGNTILLVAHIDGYNAASKAVALTPYFIEAEDSTSADTDSALYSTKATAKAVQNALNAEGFECGTADGTIGPKSQAAISQFLSANNLSDDPTVHFSLLAYLGVKPEPDPTPEPTTTAKSETTENSYYSTERSQNNTEGTMVWITSSGKKYHSYSGCSRMKNPSQVSIEYAKSLGYTACSKCW